MADGSVNTSVLPSGAYLPLSGGTLTGALSGTSATFSGNVIIGGSSPVYLKFNVQETSANRVAILYRGTQGADASMVTAFGTPYLSIGGQENLINSIQTIGFGFTNGTSYIQPAEIGFQTTSLSGYTKGDLVFATREVTTNTAPTKRMTLDSSGNLGLGVTPSAWTTFKAIEIGGLGNGIAGVSNQVVVFSNAYWNSGYKYASTGAATNYDQVTGQHRWFNAPSGAAAGDAISFTQAMTLFANGNLAVGTTTDAGYKLDVSGTSRFAASYTSSGSVAIQTWQRVGGAVSADMTYNDANTSMNFGTSTSHTLNIKTNNTTALSLASTGAATFSSSVTAGGDILANGASIFTRAASGGYQISLNAQSSTQKIRFDDLTGGAYGVLSFEAGNGSGGFIERMRITSGGKVNINNTSNTNYQLYVDGGSSPAFAAYSTSANNQFKLAGTAPGLTITNTITSPTIGGALGACTSANDFITGTAAGDMILINQFTGNKLYITNYSGGVYLTQGATSWTANSDIRIKNINSNITNAVEKLSTLQTINFCYKDDISKKENIGLIAQEVEMVFPELIETNNDGILGVRYTELIPVLIEAIKELKEELDKIKNK
jgi:hypothetical protein